MPTAAAPLPPEARQLLNIATAARLRIIREKLQDQPVECPDGARGTVKGVCLNCDGRIVAKVQHHMGYPFTYFAETLKTADEVMY